MIPVTNLLFFIGMILIFWGFGGTAVGILIGKWFKRIDENSEQAHAEHIYGQWEHPDSEWLWPERTTNGEA